MDIFKYTQVSAADWSTTATPVALPAFAPGAFWNKAQGLCPSACGPGSI